MPAMTASAYPPATSVPSAPSSVRGPAASPAVRQAIARAAAATGVDFGYLMGQARIESGFDPAARARTSSATGLYQFIDQSWLATLSRHGRASGYGWAADAISQGSGGRWRVTDPGRARAIMDLRRDPDAAAAMAAGFASDNRQHLEHRLGRAVEPVDLYLAHFLGPAGAAKFLAAHDRDPDAAAAPAFRAAAVANRAIFHAPDGTARSFGAIRARFAAKLAVDPMPAARSVPTAPAPAPLVEPVVQPADYLRLASAIRPVAGDGPRPATHAPTATGPKRAGGPMSADGRRMLDPERVRLAYLLLAHAGQGVSA